MIIPRKYNTPIPDVSSNGVFVKQLPVEGNFNTNKSWYKGLTPWQRLNSHYTYSSVRRYTHFKPFCVINDRLDFILGTTYQHNEEIFPDPCDVYFQPVTIGRRFSKGKVTGGAKIHLGGQSVGGYLLEKPFKDHPLRIGGIKARNHPSSVKLMNSSHHSPQTNPGYVRQESDGTLFLY